MGLLCAGELGNADWDKKARPVKGEPGVMSISTKTVVYTIAVPYIPVDPAKKYRLSGKFRLAKPLAAKPGKLKFGVHTYDRDKRPVEPEHSTVIARTETSLVSAAEYGQRQVTIADGRRWRIVPSFSYIAFNAENDFSDLPNRTTVAITDLKLQSGGRAVLTLKEPLRAFYAAGSRVRMHHRVAAFLYGGALNQKLDGEFRDFSGTFSGEQRGMAHDKFRKGTAFVRIVVMLEGDGVLEFRDVKFEEVP